MVSFLLILQIKIILQVSFFFYWVNLLVQSNYVFANSQSENILLNVVVTKDLNCITYKVRNLIQGEIVILSIDKAF